MNKLEQAARELLDAMKCKSLRVITQKETALREALAEQAEQRPQNCGTGYCSCIECPYEAEQAEQEPLMDYERINALREGEQNGAEDAYFFVRPENDTPTLRKMFCQGFERGFHKGLKYASHVRTKDLTDAVDAAMVEMQNIHPPLRRSECERLIRAANYAAPIHTKDLTDDEIWEAYRTVTIPVSTPKIARAAIAADREKNK